MCFFSYVSMCLKTEENSNPLATFLMFYYVWMYKKKEPCYKKAYKQIVI